MFTVWLSATLRHIKCRDTALVHFIVTHVSEALRPKFIIFHVGYTTKSMLRNIFICLCILMHQCQSQPIQSKSGDFGKIKITRKPFLKFSKQLALILYQMNLQIEKSIKEKVKVNFFPSYSLVMPILDPHPGSYPQ